ncbi:MAG TPA: L-fucose/L-arabinose isomerase family protein [Gaiellales bacterium]|nr:L-fucose/L-arabinose isomerase family protein [Gaiellales bacterium]
MTAGAQEYRSPRIGSKTVGLLSFSDGRPYVARDTAAFVADSEERLAAWLREAGYDVVRAGAPITSNDLAVSEARAIAAASPAATVFSYPVWAFPHFTMLAQDQLSGPVVQFSNVDPRFPGMVGMLAAAGGLDQVGRRYERVWGDVAEAETARRLGAILRAAAAVSSLRGSTFGRIGGRSMGMYTAVSGTDDWMRRFGVDVEEIDQWEIVRRSAEQDPARARRARLWLEQHTAAVHYDGERLTPELLERQLLAYDAYRELIAEWSLDFSGIKGQPELSTHFAIMDVAEAFLNDPYDWDGPKETHVCATEADMDGALTMQILKLLTGLPVLFADLRCYHADRGIWDLCNSGQHATWYAHRSHAPEVNLAAVELFPSDFYFPAGGASVCHLAAAGEMTFARLSRLDGRYRLQLTRGDLETYDDATNNALMQASSPTWPHAFARLDAGANSVLGRYGSNHIHGVPGDVTSELRTVCRYLGIDVDDLAAARE